MKNTIWKFSIVAAAVLASLVQTTYAQFYFWGTDGVTTVRVSTVYGPSCTLTSVNGLYHMLLAPPGTGEGGSGGVTNVWQYNGTTFLTSDTLNISNGAPTYLTITTNATGYTFDGNFGDAALSDADGFSPTGHVHATSDITSGILSTDRMPTGTVYNGSTDNVLGGIFSGNGAGLTNVTASSISGGVTNLPLDVFIPAEDLLTSGLTNSPSLYLASPHSQLFFDPVNVQTATKAVSMSSYDPAKTVTVTFDAMSYLTNACVWQVGTTADYLAVATWHGSTNGGALTNAVSFTWSPAGEEATMTGQGIFWLRRLCTDDGDTNTTNSWIGNVKVKQP